MVLSRPNSELLVMPRDFGVDQGGFSLVELITILVILGVLAATVSSRLMPTGLLQVQAARDQLISALFVAQQNAMAQSGKVQLTTAGSTIDVRIDRNGDGYFAADESLDYGGVRYPLTVAGEINFSVTTLRYDRRGHTNPELITASKNTHKVDVKVSGSGYAY